MGVIHMLQWVCHCVLHTDDGQCWQGEHRDGPWKISVILNYGTNAKQSQE